MCSKETALGQETTKQEANPKLIWNVEWQLSTNEAEAEAELDLAQWQTLLQGGLAAQPPDRLIGIPLRHYWAKLNGRWQRAIDSGTRVPTGSAPPFDSNLLEQSRALLESRMIRNGFLEGEVTLDTSSVDNHVTLILGLEPGKRQRCCTTEVNADGSGLQQSQVQALEQSWNSWQGKPLDLGP